MEDAVLVGGIVVVAIMLTSFFWVSYGAHKADQMRSDHALHVERIHESYRMQREMYGSIPVEKLLGREASYSWEGDDS
jgi:hypothetical protein